MLGNRSWGEQKVHIVGIIDNEEPLPATRRAQILPKRFSRAGRLSLLGFMPRHELCTRLINASITQCGQPKYGVIRLVLFDPESNLHGDLGLSNASQACECYSLEFVATKEFVLELLEHLCTSDKLMVDGERNMEES